MKYTTIESQGQKWLRPINVPYPNEDDQEEEGIFQLADAVLYKQMTADLLYIGSRPEGTTVDESEVREVRQHRHVFDPERAFFTLNKNTLWLWEHRDAHSDIEFRTAYTDAEPPDIDYEKEMPHKQWPSTNYVARKTGSTPFNIQNVRPLVNQLVGEEISFSRFIELLNEIANGN